MWRYVIIRIAASMSMGELWISPKNIIDSMEERGRNDKRIGNHTSKIVWLPIRMKININLVCE